MWYMLRNKRNVRIISVIICMCMALMMTEGCSGGNSGNNGGGKSANSGNNGASGSNAGSGKNPNAGNGNNNNGASGNNSGNSKNSGNGDAGDLAVSFDKKDNELLLNTEALEKNDSSKVSAGDIKEVVEVKRGDYSHEMNALGEVFYLDKYYETVNVADATFKEYKVEKGDMVKKGDTLFTYKTEPDEADIKQREAEVLQREKDYTAGYDSRKAEINQAEHDLGLLTDKDEIQIKKLEIKKLKLALKEYKETGKDIEKDKSELNKYIEGVRSTKMTAGHDGCVLFLAELKKDDPLTEGTVVAVISPQKEYCVRVDDISESTLRYNSEVTINVDKGEGSEAVSMKGLVIGANNLLTSDNAKEFAYVKILDEPKGVNWNNIIKISYTSKELKDVLIIPRTALYYEETGEGRDIVRTPYVYLYEDGHAFKRYVDVYDDGGDECVIIQGVTEGQKLAVYE